MTQTRQLYDSENRMRVSVEAVTAGANADIGATTEAVAATPSTASGLHGLIAGMWTALIAMSAKLPAALGAGGGLKVQLYDAAGAVISFAGITAVQRLVSAANSNNATLVKASAGFVFRVRVTNAAAAIRYVKLYNKAVSPTVGTDTPYEVIQCPASTTVDVPYVDGLYFSTGIGFGMVTGATDVDNTSVTAADLTSLSICYQ